MKKYFFFAATGMVLGMAVSFGAEGLNCSSSCQEKPNGTTVIRRAILIPYELIREDKDRFQRQVHGSTSIVEVAGGRHNENLEKLGKDVESRIA
jgi:hypothetical protein